MSKTAAVSQETRRWRNKFYGLPVGYKASPSWYSDDDPEKTIERDIKALWLSVERARKAKRRTR